MRKIITYIILAAIVPHVAMAQKQLETIDWGMTDETNKYCPEGTVAGTAAVAMSIVMNYYQWPLQGTGTHRYHDAKTDTDHSVDFESTSFDWSAMPKNIANCTEGQSDVMALTPPYCDEIAGYYPFNSCFTTATLHVPAGSIDAYRAADTWKEFLNIAEDAETDISNITLTPQPASDCYDLSGRKLSSDKVKDLFISGGKLRMKIER